jgi:nitroreductase
MPDEIGLFEAMYTQKALRRLKPDPVPDDMIRKLIDAAIRAPSGGNRQPWGFVVVRDGEAKRKIGEWYRDSWNKTYGAIPQEQRDRFEGSFARTYRSAEHLAFHLSEAPVHIFVCTQGVQVPGSAAGASNYGSIFPAVQNLLLAARGLGLGASLTTLHKLHEAEVKELLGIPDDVETVALVPVGYPRGKYGPAERRPVEEVMYFERWGATG